VADAEAGVATQVMLTFRFSEQVRAFLGSLAAAPVEYVHTSP